MSRGLHYFYSIKLFNLTQYLVVLLFMVACKPGIGTEVFNAPGELISKQNFNVLIDNKQCGEAFYLQETISRSNLTRKSMHIKLVMSGIEVSSESKEIFTSKQPLLPVILKSEFRMTGSNLNIPSQNISALPKDLQEMTVSSVNTARFVDGEIIPDLRITLLNGRRRIVTDRIKIPAQFLSDLFLLSRKKNIESNIPFELYTYDPDENRLEKLSVIIRGKTVYHGNNVIRCNS